MTDDLSRHSNFLSQWLHNDALPLWWERGVDHVGGGFFETVDLAGRGAPGLRRARVQPRQIYCYAEAGLDGWKGPWRQAIEHGLTYFDEVYLVDEGYYGALATDDGTLIDERFDLYNQAFALLAFAQIAGAMPFRAASMAERAEALLSILKARFAHPEAGFEEAVPRVLPLCSNPHMHLFEAALAWEKVLGAGVGPWSTLADEIAGLCMRRFIDPRTGALREFFDGDWNTYPGAKGTVIEPGHQFEWAWLLTRWAQARNDPDALRKAERLFEIGTDAGVCDDRRVAVMTLDDTFVVRDPVARLWPQTEWLKAAIRFAEMMSGPRRAAYLASAERACVAIRAFLAVPTPGLWRDKMQRDGTFVEEAAPASTFYHLVCAVRELESGLGRIRRKETMAA